MSRKTKSSRYPSRILLTVVREYEANLVNGVPGMPVRRLAVDSGIMEDFATRVSGTATHYGEFLAPTEEAIRLAVESGWLEKFNRGGGEICVRPTPSGIAHANWLERPWYVRVWDWAKGDIRTALVAVVTTLITMLIGGLLSRLLGWL